MIQVVLVAYVVIKWFGAWSLYEGGTACFTPGLCIFALIVYFGSLLSRGTMVSLGSFINDGGIGIFIAPTLWILFFILYPAGLVDWLVNWHVLGSNQGYLLSHVKATPFDIAMLVLAIFFFLSPFFKLWKASRS